MSSPRKYPIDLDLWRKQKEAPESEWWKWDWWKTWDPVFGQYFRGEKSLDELECPVCGKKALYAYFLTVSIARFSSKLEGKRVYVADRYFGCHACQTQVRDRGEVPHWMKDEDIIWANDGLRKLAERNWP